MEQSGSKKGIFVVDLEPSAYNLEPSAPQKPIEPRTSPPCTWLWELKVRSPPALLAVLPPPCRPPRPPYWPDPPPTPPPSSLPFFLPRTSDANLASLVRCQAEVACVCHFEVALCMPPAWGGFLKGAPALCGLGTTWQSTYAHRSIVLLMYFVCSNLVNIQQFCWNIFSFFSWA
jgi:hypothetical protein